MSLDPVSRYMTDRLPETVSEPVSGRLSDHGPRSGASLAKPSQPATPREPLPGTAGIGSLPRRRRQIWDIEQNTGGPKTEPLLLENPDMDPDPDPDAPSSGPTVPPLMPPSMSQFLSQSPPPSLTQTPPASIDPPAATGRARTRILGFHAQDLQTDAFARAALAPQAASRSADGAPEPNPSPQFPAGWLVVVDGPGRGAHFAVTASVSTIGRGPDQAIPLDFGDVNISRSTHAAVAYDAEQNRFFLGHGNKSNVVRHNGQPVLATEELFHSDLIRIGRTTLRFVALCGPDFTWGETEDGDPDA